MAGQEQFDRLAVREAQLHFFRETGPPGEAKIRSFPSVLQFSEPPRDYHRQCLVILEKGARPEMWKEQFRDAVVQPELLSKQVYQRTYGKI